MSAQDKYDLKVPGGLAFSEFRGYEDWQAVGVIHPQEAQTLNVIVANPAMIEAFRAGIPGNGRPFPDGSRMAKIRSGDRRQRPDAPYVIEGTRQTVRSWFHGERMQAICGLRRMGIGRSSSTTPLRARSHPSRMTDTPPQANDARCGFACHTTAKAKGLRLH